MSAPTYVLPSTQNVTLVLPQPAVGGTVTWSITHSGPTGVGVLTPSQDTQSCLFTPGTDTTDTGVVTVTVKAQGQQWQPDHQYRIGDQIYDQNGHIQQVTATTGHQIQTVTYPSIQAQIPPSQKPFGYPGSVPNYADPAGDQPAYSGGNSYQATGSGTPTYAWVGAGYSTRGGKGISSPNVTGTDTVETDASYSEIGPNGPIAYTDAGGVTHSTGWQIAKSSSTYQENVPAAPSFSTSGGTTVDGEITWTDEGAISTLATYGANITISATAFAPNGNFVPVG